MTSLSFVNIIIIIIILYYYYSVLLFIFIIIITILFIFAAQSAICDSTHLHIIHYNSTLIINNIIYHHSHNCSPISYL